MGARHIRAPAGDEPALLWLSLPVMNRGSDLSFQLSQASGIFVSIIIMSLSGCGGHDAGRQQSVPEANQPIRPPPVVLEWYPSPKTQQPQLLFDTAPATSMSQQTPGQWAPAQSTNQSYSYPGQPVPQAWIIVPAPPAGYGGQIAGYAGQYNSGAATGVWQQPVPVWNAPPPQPQTYYPQAPVQQFQSAPAQQGTYVQRPWGQYTESDSGKSSARGINTWQTTNPLPAWTVPGYSGSTVPYPAYNGTYPGAPVPGYVW
jgi:hypothetical protein